MGTKMSLANGSTVILYGSGVPEQPLSEGVVVMMATKGLSVVFVALKEGIAPMPEAARPIDVFELLHFMPPVGLLIIKSYEGRTAPS